MKSLLLIFVRVILGVLGQLSMKQGMLEVGYVPLELAKFGSSFSRIITTPFVLLGLFLYVVSTMFWLVVLSRVELSYAYPMISKDTCLLFSSPGRSSMNTFLLVGSLEFC